MTALKSFFQAFVNDDGFIFNPTKTEFVNGRLQQKKFPGLDNATCWAKLSSTVNLNFGQGSLIGAASNGAAILPSSGLDCTGFTSKFVQYAAALNADELQKITIKIKYAPSYTGAPASTSNIFTLSETVGSLLNLIMLSHDLSGNLNLQMNDSVGDPIVSTMLGIWVPTSGQVYEIELNVDLTGITRLFVDGIQFSSNLSTIGTRSGSVSLLRIGGDYDTGGNCNAIFSDFVVFSTIQHTADYAPGYTTCNTLFLGDIITFPEMNYVGFGTLQSFDNFMAIDSNLPKYIINNHYWSGAAWVASNDSYAQANRADIISANISSLTASDIVSIKAITLSGNIQMAVDSVNVEYIGQTIPECMVYCDLSDILQQVVVFSALNAKIFVKPSKAFYHSGLLVTADEYGASFDQWGVAQVGVIETESVAIPVDFKIIYKGSSGKQVKILFDSVIVPNQTTINLTTLTTIKV